MADVRQDGVCLSTRETSGFLLGSAVVVFVAFGLFVVFDFRSNIYLGWVSAVVGLIVLSAVLTFASITVQVNDEDLTVRSSIFRFRLARIGMDQISSVATEPFSKALWGGWGFRLRGRDRALVLNGTEANVVEKSNGTKFYLAAQDAPRITEVILKCHSRTAST